MPTEQPVTSEPGGMAVEPAALNLAPQPGDDARERAGVQVASTDIYAMEDGTLRFFLVIEGTLPTFCHQLRSLVRPPAGDEPAAVKLYALAEPGKDCTPDKPFAATLPLAGIPAGRRQVLVDGLSAGFINLPAENANAAGIWELYAWQMDGAWYFALFEGLNPWKTLDQVQAPATAIGGEGALREALEHMAPGTSVFWTTLDYGGLALPPREMRGELRLWAEQLGLTLLTLVR